MYQYVVLLASIILPMCLGSTYSWSVFAEPLRKALSLGQGSVHAPFTTFYIVFPFVTLFSGKMLASFGPTRCAMAGGLVFGTGWFLAGCFPGSFLMVVIGVGVLGGAGVGMAYLAPITTCVRWFPNHKGLVTGLSVAGFGVGAVLVARVASAMFLAGATPFAVFRTLGVCFAAIAVSVGFFLRNPKGAGEDNASLLAGSPSSHRAALAQPAFWLLYFAMFTGLMAGFTIVTNLKELLPHGSVAAGLMAVALFPLANAAGRIGWGWTFDRVRSDVAIRANLLIQAAILLGASWILRTPAGLAVFAVLTGLNYGGVLVIYASTTARHWGAERMGRVYGYLFSCNGFAAFTPLLAGWAFDRSGTFFLPLAVIGACQLAAVFATSSARLADAEQGRE